MKRIIIFLSISTIVILNAFGNSYVENDSANFYYKKSIKLYDAGEYLLAEEHLLKAADFADKSKSRSILAFSLHYIGMINHWKSEFQKSINNHKEAKNIFLQLNNNKFVAISNNLIAMRFEALSQFDSASTYYQTNIQNKDSINFKYCILFSYQQIAGLYAKQVNYKKAYYYLQAGIEYADSLKKKLSLAELYLKAGELFLENHINQDIALEYLLEAKKLFAELNKLYGRLRVEVFIGDIYYQRGNYSLALASYNNALASANNNMYTLLSDINYKIGKVHKKLGQYDQAIGYFEKSIEIMCPVCPEIAIHKAHIELADVLLVVKNFNRAYIHLSKSIDIAIDAKAIHEQIISLEFFGDYYKQLNKSDSALFYLQQAYNYAKDLKLFDAIHELAEKLGAVHISLGDYKKAVKYYQIASQMNDSLVVIGKSNEVAKLEMRFEMEKKEKEKALEAIIMQGKIDKQKAIRNYTVLALVFFITIGILLALAYKKTRKVNAQLAKKNQEISLMAGQIQESGKRKQKYFTQISHEIRTPLTLIKAPLESLLKVINNNDIRKTINLALNNTNKLKALVNQILDLQKIDDAHLVLNLQYYDIVDSFKEVITSFEGYCLQRNCKFYFHANVSNANVLLDNIRLSSMISNILSNAIKFNKEDGTVRVDLLVLSRRIETSIRDTGFGIPSNYMDKLGNRYYRIENKKSFIEGTGIGLAYVKELTKLMNGELDITSEVNTGTTVKISLPCDEIEITNNSKFQYEFIPKYNSLENLAKSLEQPVVKKDFTILIIEDNIDLKNYLHDLFSKEFRVISAKDGTNGEKLAIESIPDIILSDIMMPGIPGNALCYKLKNNIATSHIPIILFTAKGSAESIVDGYDCGADDYIVKPFEIEALVKKVSNIISTREKVIQHFNLFDFERKISEYPDLDKKFLKECFLTIFSNVGNHNFTVELLADKLNMQKKTLTRKLKALIDKTPSEIIRHVKMMEAAKLIKAKKRVNEAAFLVGYEDTTRFSNAFKKTFGVPPSKYFR